VTTSGSNPLIVLTAGIWQDVGGSGTIASASWNGAAFTKATSTRTTANESEIWYLVASTTGSKTISITINGNTDAIKLGTASFSGVSTSTSFDTVKSANGFSTTPSVGVTPKFSSEVFVDSLARWTTLDATTSLTALYKDYASSTLAAAAYKIATTSSAVTDTYTAAGPSQDWVLAMAAFEPATSTTGTASSTSATTTLSYDNNGNLTAEGSSTFSWDYRNQMTQSGNGLATSSYAYDQDGNRVKLTEGSVTTYFPSTLYSTGATTTKNIFANGMLLSTVESAGSGGGSGSTATSTPALVASVAAGAGADSVTTAAIDTTGATFIIAAVSYNTGATPTISDSKGNTWTPLTASAVTGTVTQRLYYAANPVVGSGHTFSNTAASNFSSICVAAFSGVSTSSPFDRENGATSSLSTIQTGSVTPAVNQELVATGLGWNVARTTYPPTIDSSFTVSTSSNFASGNHYGCSIGFLSQATSSAVNPTWTLGSAQSDAARIAAFRPLVTPGSGSGTTASTTIRYIATDNLTGANIVLDASGGVAEALDYAPFGALRIDTKTNYSGVRNKYAGTIYDTLSGLNYMQARYQNSSRGQFISEDPVFLGDPRQQVLTDPQSLNSFSYANDNPITKSDPTGRAVGIDDAAGFVVGGFVGTAVYAGQSALTRQPITLGGLGGSFLSGGIVGVGAVNAPETGGLSAVAAAAFVGGGAGFIGNTTKQGIDLATGAQKTPFDMNALAVSTGAGFFFGGLTEGALPNARIPVFSSGQNSFYAIGQSAQTRIANGFASTMSPATALKLAVGSQSANAYKTSVSALMDIGRVQNIPSQQTSAPQK
jgi:RHS repeat-associated protein